MVAAIATCADTRSPLRGSAPPPDDPAGEDGVREAIEDKDLQDHPHDLAVGADPDTTTLEKITAEVTGPRHPRGWQERD